VLADVSPIEMHGSALRAVWKEEEQSAHLRSDNKVPLPLI
jgi:hypothetical protein